MFEFFWPRMETNCLVTKEKKVLLHLQISKAGVTEMLASVENFVNVTKMFTNRNLFPHCNFEICNLQSYSNLPTLNRKDNNCKKDNIFFMQKDLESPLGMRQYVFILIYVICLTFSDFLYCNSTYYALSMHCNALVLLNICFRILLMI